jgi:hypothetical protein
MKLLSEVPHRLRGRFAPDAVPIECDCGEHLLWEKSLGTTVKCPTCKRTEVVPLDNAQITADPALKVAPDKMFDDGSLSHPAPADAAQAGPMTDTALQNLQLTRLHAVLVKEAEMKDVVALPGALNEMLTGLMREAHDAAAGLQSAAAEHSVTVGRIKTVTAQVREATAKSNDLLNQMMGGNNPPLDDSTKSSPQV